MPLFTPIIPTITYGLVQSLYVAVAYEPPPEMHDLATAL